MSNQLIDWFIFFTTSATFVLYKRQTRQPSDTTKAIASVVVKSNDAVITGGRNDRSTAKSKASASAVIKSNDAVITKGRKDRAAATSERQLQKQDSIREKYKPWSMTQTAFNENQKGWVYARGYSPRQRGGSVLFYRPGLHKLQNEKYEAYFRALLNSIEVCVADSLRRSKGRIGRCNVILDAKGVGPSFFPPFSTTKKLLGLCQNLFVDRLGIVLIANMGAAAQWFFKMVMPFLPSEVRLKVHILPTRGKDRSKMLQSLVEEQFIPIWLGGRDNYTFDATEYYVTGIYKSGFITDEQGVEYAR